MHKFCGLTEKYPCDHIPTELMIDQVPTEENWNVFANIIRHRNHNEPQKELRVYVDTHMSDQEGIRSRLLEMIRYHEIVLCSKQ
jgi:hypothetical protein